jgi:mono/diheme cytochrome c family protein
MNKSVKHTAIAFFLVAALLGSVSALTAKPEAASFQSAKSLYAQKCSVCHGNDGSGNTAKGKELKVRNWKTDPEVKKMSDAKMIEITMKGKGKMEGYEKTLGKEKVEMLVQYSKELMGK